MSNKTEYMREYMRQYRLKNKEYCEKEKERDRIYTIDRYRNNQEYREKTIKNAISRYHRLKEMKNNNTDVNSD